MASTWYDDDDDDDDDDVDDDDDDDVDDETIACLSAIVRTARWGWCSNTATAHRSLIP